MTVSTRYPYFNYKLGKNSSRMLVYTFLQKKKIHKNNLMPQAEFELVYINLRCNMYLTSSLLILDSYDHYLVPLLSMIFSHFRKSLFKKKSQPTITIAFLNYRNNPKLFIVNIVPRTVNNFLTELTTCQICYSLY